jgi:DNA (cytosine-5)-methyltransferase 1
MALAYYNENDPRAAAWLRELIKEGHIASGHVDGRSIDDVRPGDLVGYTQCHFFAGIGGWSYALRLAGWPDDRAVWTGSCPCQPFSAAGKGGGFDDPRHLWPSFGYLIDQHAPSVIFGEQVASPAGLAWLDVVLADLEGSDYACQAADLCAAGVGAPHIRQRLYWVAHHHHLGRIEHAQRNGEAVARGEEGARGDDAGRRGELGDVSGEGSGRYSGAIPRAKGGAERGVRRQLDEPELASRLGNNNNTGLEGRGVSAGGRAGERAPWTPSDVVWCRDGKWRPVEPGSFPLAHGIPGRVGLLRGYGNAIVPQVAAAFIEATGLV